MISPEAAAEPGEWDTDRAPYQREIMNVFSDPRIHTIVVKASAQVGKTEILNNMAGYLIDKDPSPMMMVQPTLDMAKAWSKDRLTPMVRDTPCLQDKIAIGKRDADNEILRKKFPGGHITISGANSPASLASRPIRVVFLDEVDRYPTSAGEEGDPSNLAIKRTTTFWNKKIIYVSTPTVEGKSRIETAFQESDQRHFKVPCPHCNTYQELTFWQIKRPYEDAPPEAWEYVCSENGCIIEERHKMWMLKNGMWESKKATRGVAGFWIHEVYSPWVTWTEMVENFLEKKKLPDTYKTFVNTSLAELWKEDMEGDGLKAEAIQTRTETYSAQVPEGVFVLTCAIDVQDDRFEMEFIGWGMDREQWSIKYEIKHVDPALKDAWIELDSLIEQTFIHQSGMPMKATITTIDAGGHHTEMVYKWVKKKAQQRKRVYAVRGHSVANQPVLAKVSRNNDYRVKVFYLGTDTAKEMIYAQLAKIDQPGPGYMHFPEDYDEEYFKQLTSERKVTVYEKGKTKTKWVKPRARRNEALDIRVYNYAAFWILKADMNKVRANFKKRVAKWIENNDDDDTVNETTTKESEKVDNGKQEKPKRPARTRKRKRKSSYVKDWNK